MVVIMEETQNQPTIPTKRIKYQEVVDNEEQDRIGALPDCLLLEILSRLPSTKDAIKTGTLSKRWKRLWTWVPNLLFQRYDSEQPWLHFGSYVYETLTKTRDQNLKKFELHTSFDFLYKSQVNYWIRYALSHNVQELNLRLWKTDTEVKCPLDRVIFTASCFTDLTLEGCILNPWRISRKKIPSGAISWKNLRRLCIFNEVTDEDLIENILSGSPVLETLVLNRCYGYKQLNITSKSVKKLVFSGYMDPECRDDFADIIKINAPNILSLTICGGLLLWKLLLVNVSSLVEADLDYTFMGHWETMRNEAEEDMLKGFIQNLRHVKHLEIGVFCYKALSRLEAKGFDFPSNMKFPDVTLPTYSDDDSIELDDWSDSDSVN